MRTLQETFDYVVDKIVGQGGRCMSGIDCAYEDGEGKHCAIGWLLDPYNSELMGFVGPVRFLLEEYPEFMPPLIANNINVFSALQTFHDNANMRNREIVALKIQKQGINISNPNVQKWIEMGER